VEVPFLAEKGEPGFKHNSTKEEEI